MQKTRPSTGEMNSRIFPVILCAVGLLVNLLGVRAALSLNLPLFLDVVGTALASALGGYIPGIVVGFLTNLINGIGDYTTAYYGCLSVLIAVSAAWFAQKGFFGKLSRLPVVILAFSLIGGALGSVLTWALYGFDFGTGISAPLAHRIYEAGAMNLFWSQFTADMLIDLLDKTVAVLLIALVLRLLPDKLKERCFLTGWQQTPMSRANQLAAENKLARKTSLRFKIILLTAASMCVVAVAMAAISYVNFRDAAVKEKTAMAYSAAQAAQSAIDGNRVEAYFDQGEAADGYLETSGRLNSLRAAFTDIASVYVFRIEDSSCRVLFASDGTDEPDPLPSADTLLSVLPGLWESIEPVLTKDVSGLLLSVYEPVFDSKGVCRCWAAVEMNMENTVVSSYQFLARVLSLFFGFFIMMLTVTIWMVEYSVILPINAMALTTGQYAFDTEQSREEAVESIQKLNIRTGDEIENLYDSVVETTEEMVKSIEQVEKQNEVINKLQNGLILVLADMVESRDQCTGDHVRKTAAYADVIMRQLKKDGVYTDRLTDEFVHDVVNSAPLHDVGKIHVPDFILNKKGRLTDEEFDQIKQHTVSGSEIISRATDMVSEGDEGFLKEAKNLALFHHEKWDGSGYPRGLKGEMIPLSARIMAVADVFDALVSRRSYKEGFSLEKAMQIIREGSGTHFDPKVVEAFEEARDEVDQIMRSHQAHAS